ncbi:MAG: NUDIX domain-containing protein [Rhodocyclaceae bacterium]|nr:NUDIX domain-containing protein [Rhodocyclaceae bacterium]
MAGAIEPIGKACACLVDARGRLLVFDHPGDGGMQLPKGTIEPGEQPEDAVRRELLEESGIRFEGPLEPLGTLDRFCAGGIEGNRHDHDQRWHLFLMRSDAAWPERFEHVAVGSPEEEGLVFAFRWLAAGDPLDGFALPYRQAIERVRAALAG